MRDALLIKYIANFILASFHIDLLGHCNIFTPNAKKIRTLNRFTTLVNDSEHHRYAIPMIMILVA